MSIRGRRSYARLRGQMTTPLKARPFGLDVKSAESPEADADRLMASFRMRALFGGADNASAMRNRLETASHWSQVSNVIARRTRERARDDPNRRFQSWTPTPHPIARPRAPVRPSVFSRMTPSTRSNALSPPENNAFVSSSLASAPTGARRS